MSLELWMFVVVVSVVTIVALWKDRQVRKGDDDHE